MKEAVFLSTPREGVSSTRNPAKRLLAFWRQRKREEILHPFLKERIPMGLIPFIRAQLLARYLRGDLDDYPACLWR